VFLVVVSLLLLGASTARAEGYEPTCAALYDSSTDGAMANVLPGTHAFTANNVVRAVGYYVLRPINNGILVRLGREWCFFVRRVAWWVFRKPDDVHGRVV